ncbi:MAG: hypothetical protein KAJ45_07635, partial [Desulfobulbaceae bacterium]|nr:hypothetical protein [Desulfobulbaceae bacterium]
MTDLTTNILASDGFIPEEGNQDGFIPEGDNQDDLLSNLDKTTRQKVLAHAKLIYSSVTYSDDKITATMDFPALSRIDNEILAYALYQVLFSNFSINIPNTKMTRINAGNSVSFTAGTAQNGEPPFRSVAIILDPNLRILKISGTPHVDGTDEYSELAFEWKRQSGKIAGDGKIDLKKINM